MSCGYTGHAPNSGLQRHSLGDHYPYTLIGIGFPTVRYAAFDCRTGNVGRDFATAEEALRDIVGIRIRNLINS